VSYFTELDRGRVTTFRSALVIFVPTPTPLPVECLHAEGVSPAFIDFLREHDLKVVA